MGSHLDTFYQQKSPGDYYKFTYKSYQNAHIQSVLRFLENPPLSLMGIKE